jgi:hypothetical protein
MELDLPDTATGSALDRESSQAGARRDDVRSSPGAVTATLDRVEEKRKRKWPEK